MDSIEESQCTNSVEVIPCDMDPCPTTFTYETWSKWNECSKTCKKGIDDKGFQIRTRTCEPVKDCNIGKIGNISLDIIEKQKYNFGIIFCLKN